MRQLVVTWLLMASTYAFGNGAADALQLKGSCVLDKDSISIHFELLNPGQHALWIFSDTEPWAPSFLSNRIAARAEFGAPEQLRGPIAFGHAVAPTLVPAGGSVRGVVYLHHAFPDLRRVSASTPVKVSWEWQGLASHSARLDHLSPTSRVSGGVTVHANRCS